VAYSFFLTLLQWDVVSEAQDAVPDVEREIREAAGKVHGFIKIVHRQARKYQKRGTQWLLGQVAKQNQFFQHEFDLVAQRDAALLQDPDVDPSALKEEEMARIVRAREDLAAGVRAAGEDILQGTMAAEKDLAAGLERATRDVHGGVNAAQDDLSQGSASDSRADLLRAMRRATVDIFYAMRKSRHDYRRGVYAARRDFQRADAMVHHDLALD
jgi:hypothetical protein